MKNAVEQAEAIRAIVRIIIEQAVLERHQRSSGASTISISDGQVHAYDKIVCVMKPFLEHAREGGAASTRSVSTI
ncbi:MAG: hypothetical protein ACRD3D_15005 [Terriglobia bacterium]